MQIHLFLDWLEIQVMLLFGKKKESTKKKKSCGFLLFVKHHVDSI